MLELVRGAKLIVETCAQVRPKETVLVITDDAACPIEMGRAVAEAANSVGAEAAQIIIKPGDMPGYEPPQPVAQAMKSANVVIIMFGRSSILHSNARKDATTAGARVYTMSEVPHDYFEHEITKADLERIKELTERLADKLTKAKRARVTAPGGTDITMSLEGRQGLALHPLSRVVGPIPDYAESTISPVEGTAEGTLVIDIWVGGWGYPLRAPMKCVIKSGKAVQVTGGDDADRLRGELATDATASNVAELGIGTSHTIPRKYLTSRRGGGMLGYIHIALGRNNDIGGQTWSRIHADGMIDCPTVKLDDEFVMKDGKLV
ncbi:MAG: hypothetical protein V1737_04080 [Chloroflexota bacterium]